MNLYPSGALIAGQYEVAGRPLMGGMGIVYLCLDHGNGKRPVALKTFRPEYLPDRAARDRFLREGTTWVNLGAHPHVVRCYEVTRVGDGTEVYLALELVAKEQGREDASLRPWLTPGKPLPVDQSLLFALQIARGMKHATEVLPGFVHRDLKPENVLVGADKLTNANVNRLRVTDFGLASVLQGDDGRPTTDDIQPPESAVGGRSSVADPRQGMVGGRTQLTHGIVGTPLYMAPEQWKGELVSVATDVYALGCILVEMLTGQRAVMGQSIDALQQAHCAGQVCALPASLPEGVRELTRRCLAFKPEARWGTWGEVEVALAGAYAQVCGQAAPELEATQAISRAERVAAGWSYNSIGISYADIGKSDVAQGYFERAAEVGRVERDRQLEGAVLGNLGTATTDLGDMQRAIGYHEQALTIHRETNNWYGESNALGNLGNAYFQLGDVRRAIGYYEQQLAITREIGDQRGKGSALGNLGVACRSLGDARRAIRYCEQHLVTAREMGDRSGEGNALGNLGNAYADLDEVQQAIGYHEQALSIFREIGDRRAEGVVLGGLGVAYKNLGDTARAIEYHKQHLVIAREIRDRRGEGNALGNLGIAYKNLGDTSRAIECYEQRLAIARDIGDIRGEAETSSNMAVLLVQLGRPAEAIPHAQRAAQVFTQIGHVSYARRAQQLVSQLQAGGALSSGTAPVQVLGKFARLIDSTFAAL